MDNNLNNDFEVRKATLAKLGGNTDGLNTIYEVDLAILDKTGQGGGGGAVIDDTTISTGKVWSSNKVSNELGTKQATLTSGTNIKTINNQSILGEGNLVVGGAEIDDTVTTASKVWSSVKTHNEITCATEGMATQSWVSQQGYLTASSLNGYATQSWVSQQGYLTAVPSEYVKSVTLTQAEYDALAVKDAHTLYVISDAE